MQSWQTSRAGEGSSTASRKLNRTFTRLENQRAQTVRELARWSNERLFFRPTRNAWSALEVLDHLIRTEKLVYSDALHNLRKQTAVSASERMKLRLFLCMFRLPVRVRVPEKVAMILPGDPKPLQDLNFEWQQERQLWRALFDSPLAAVTDRAAMCHPMVGWMDLRGALLFLSVHLKHHAFQLQRLNSYKLP